MKKFDFKKIGMNAAGVSTGAVGGQMLNKIGFVGNLKPVIRGALKIVAGAVLPELAPKNQFIGDVGNGVIAAGAIDAFSGMTNNTAPVEGIEGDQFVEDQFVVDEDIDDDNEEVSGLENENPISGADDDPISEGFNEGNPLD